MKNKRILTVLLSTTLALNPVISAFAAEPGDFNAQGGFGGAGGFNAQGGFGGDMGFDFQGGPGSFGNQGNFSHGSDTIITEEELVTEIPKDYDVNSDLQAKASKGLYSCLFDKTTIQDVSIKIPEENWNYMLQNAGDKPTVMTESVTIGNDTIYYAGIKTKGNLTLSSILRSNSDRFSFTVNFGKFIKKKAGYSETQNFYGLSKVALNNIYGDATLMKEYLSYELMTKMGVPTPEYCLINLYVNDEFWGIYMMVESIDSSLTQRTLGVKTDYLVKPESSGGDLNYNSALDAYYNSETDTFDFTELLYPNGKDKEMVYPTDRSNPLTAYAGLWENDEDTFEDVVEMLPTLFSWLKKLNKLNTSNPNAEDYCKKVEEIINADAILRYFAVNTYLVNLDSYQSEKMQNYALCIDENGYANILPWDYNYSFGTYGVGSAEAMINFSIEKPVISTTLEQRPLLNVLLQNDSYREKFNQYLKDCCTITSVGGTTSDGESYEKGYFASVINSYSSLLESTYAKDPTAFYTVEQYLTAKDSLIKLIDLRSTAVLQQLSGNNETVTTDLKLSSMGDSMGGMGDFKMPNDNRKNTTLTDNVTGIRVTGSFMPEASLKVEQLTQVDINYPANFTIDNVYAVFSIDVEKNTNFGFGQMPQMNGNMIAGEKNNGFNNQFDILGGMNNSNQFGMIVKENTLENTSYAISLPVSSDVLGVAMLNDDGNLTIMPSIAINGMITITPSTLGTFVIICSNK